MLLGANPCPSVEPRAHSPPQQPVPERNSAIHFASRTCALRRTVVRRSPRRHKSLLPCGPRTRCRTHARSHPSGSPRIGRARVARVDRPFCLCWRQSLDSLRNQPSIQFIQHVSSGHRAREISICCTPISAAYGVLTRPCRGRAGSDNGNRRLLGARPVMVPHLLNEHV